MGVRHHRAIDGPPGIDKKVTLLAVQPEVGRFEEWVFVQADGTWPGAVQGRQSEVVTNARQTAYVEVELGALRELLTSIPAAEVDRVILSGLNESVPATTAIAAPAPAIAASAATAAATSAAATTATILTWLRLVDRQTASAVVLVVQSLDRREGLGVAPHLDEAKPAAPARLSVHDHLRASHFAKRGEQVFQVGISDRECKIADIQLLAHLQTPWDLGRAILTRVRLSGSKERGRTGRPNGWAR